MEDPVRADAHKHLGARLGQPGADGDGVVAGVEDEQRHVTLVGKQIHEVAHLGDGGRRGVLAGRDASGIEGSGPAVRRPIELADPLIGPAGHDGLAGGVLRSRVIEAPFGAGLGVAAVPGGGVHGEHHRPVGRVVRHEDLTQPVAVDRPQGERLVQAAVAAAEHRLQAERRHRGDRSRRAQCGVAQLEERVTPARAATVQVRSKADQLVGSPP